MEESPTPWLIADAIRASGTAGLWMWVTVVTGSAVVLLGALTFGS